MSYEAEEAYAVYDETDRRARKAHECHACGEQIAPGHSYTHVAIVFDGRGRTVKRCARCQAIHLHLRTLGGGEMWPDEKLDCGEEYRAHWGKEPPAEIAALAFALPGEVKP